MSYLPKFEAKTSEAENRVENEKKGTLGGHQAEVSPFPAPVAAVRKGTRAAKSSVDYWRERVRPRVLPGGAITPELYVRMKESGRDAWVCLSTANKIEAAKKARDLWQVVQVKGLRSAIMEFRPKEAARPERSSTVGELLGAARKLAPVRPSSLAEYEKSLRRLVAGVLGMKPTPDVYAAGSEASIAWRRKIEAASLDVLTPARVESWRKQYVDAATDERARLSRKNTAGSVIRNSRSFFTPAMVQAIGSKLRLPSPVPLVGISAGTATRRFKTEVDPQKLYAQAKKELKGDTLTAFLLCVVGGLRRGEADMLPWEHVDLDAGLVHVRPTRWFVPKTEESQRSTPIPRDVVAHLKRRRAANPDSEFVLDGAPPERKRDPKEYRCACWVQLMEWLRAKGFTSQNPVHELRKLSGSLINKAAGLEAARRHLGHRNISTTAASYVAGSAVMVDLSGSRKKGANA